MPKEISTPNTLDRRHFLQTGAAAAASFMIVPRHVLGEGLKSLAYMAVPVHICQTLLPMMDAKC